MKGLSWFDKIKKLLLGIDNQQTETNMAKVKRAKTSKGFAQGKNGNRQEAINLTAFGKEFLAEIASKLGTSASEVVEEMAKGKLALTTNSPEKAIAVTPGAQLKESSTIEVVLQPPRKQEETAKISELEAKLAEKDSKISKLEKTLAQQEAMEQGYQTASVQSQQQSIYINELETARSRQRQEIQDLNHRLNQLQAQLAQKPTPQAEMARKDQQIRELKSQVQALQGFASIGENYLNRWRSRSIK